MKRGTPVTLIILLLVSRAIGVEWKSTSIPNPLRHEGPTLWLRCYVQVPDRLVKPEGGERDLWRSSTVFAISALPGPFEVYLNGKSIIKSEGIPLGQEQRFKVPKEIVAKDQFNSLVFRLEEKSAKQGLTSAPVLMDYFHELVLGPEWQFTTTSPAEIDFAMCQEKPAHATYLASQFKLSSRPLARTVESIKGLQVPPEEALNLLETDDDLAVDTLLSEPEIAQPTHFGFDARGRMWVAQYRQYPYPAGVTMISRDQYYRSKYDRIPPAPPHHDRGADIISVHEDKDGDGVYESSLNILEGLNMANSVAHGQGGIWVMHTPYLLFYPDQNGDDQPDGPPEVRLSGFGLEDTHSVANGLAWGPDGWLYGGQGSTTTSRVTRPGFDDPPIYNEGPIVWRYHPRTKRFEVFADGGGNTFGLTFDAEGRLFSGHNGGNTRGFHFVQGGQYLKQGKNPGKFGPPPNPYSYGELSMMKSSNPIPRFSHLAITVDSVAIPDRLQGHLLAIDPLHHNFIASKRQPKGSTFETTDFGFPLKSTDLTFRPVYLANAPCGGVIFSDFREQFIAHGQNYQGQIDPDSGRIYRLRGKNSPLLKDRNLASKSSRELVSFLDHDNQWHRQTAVRVLAGRKDPSIIPLLEKLLFEEETHPALEALWTLHQMDALNLQTALHLLDHSSPMVRAWNIRLRGDNGYLAPEFFSKLKALSSREPDSEVRCQILSTASRIDHKQALPLVAQIIRRDDDLKDPFIPLMAWHVMESHCQNHPESVLETIREPSFWSSSFFLNHIASRLMRRFAEPGTRKGFLNCLGLLELAPNQDGRTALMKGFEEAFEGRTLPTLPDQLLRKLGKTSLSMQIRSGDKQALQEGLELLKKPEAPTKERLSIIRALGTVQGGRPAREQLVYIAVNSDQKQLALSAIIALQIYLDPSVPKKLLADYSKNSAERQAAIRNLLASRPTWALNLVKAHQSGIIPKKHFNPVLLGRLSLHQNPNLSALIEKHFPGTPDFSPAQKIASVQKVLDAQPGNPYAGESLYTQRCASCHKLFFKGGSIGPDLTRYQRDDLGTMLVSIIDPSAEIREGFENLIVTTTDGRILGGFLADEDRNNLVIRGFDGADIIIPRTQIKSLIPAQGSLMPAGLLDGLDDTQIRNLFAYLRISQPITK